MKLLVWAAVAWGLLAVVGGCSTNNYGDCDCQPLKDEILDDIGWPDEVSSFQMSGYSSETWIYTNLGRVYSFESGDLACCCCDFTAGHLQPTP